MIGMLLFRVIRMNRVKKGGHLVVLKMVGYL